MFRASLPLISMFVKVLETLVRLMLPALTQSMKALVPYLPILAQGFGFVAQGIAAFIKDLGPGMKDAAIVFKTLMLGVKGILIALAYSLDGLAIALRGIGIMAGWVSAHVRKYWDELRNHTAVIFDGIRHDVAHIWDMIFQNTIGAFLRFNSQMQTNAQQFRHHVANVFDGLRHDIASIWDLIWNNTVGRVERGYTDVMGWFHKLPGSVQQALRGLGQMLEGIATAALNLMWSGFKSVGSSILHWFTGLGHGILNGLKSLFGIASPSKAMYDIGRNLGLGLEHGIQSRYGAIKGVVGKLGGSVTSWIIQALHFAGKPMSWLPALSRLVSLESGGNPRAVDPIAVMGEHASGLWQMLPSTFASYGGRGSLFNPIVEGIAALRYISARYGSPFNIPGLFGGGYRGYAKGGWIKEPILGMGLHSGITYGFGENAPGRPEYVSPGGGGTVINNYYLLDDANPDASALRTIKKIKRYKERHGNQALGIG
jgi:hypothetical protein